MASRFRSALRWAVDSYVLFVVIGLVIGLAIAPAALQTGASNDGTVAVVHVDGSIDGAQAAQYSAMMSQARSEADAVVIVANSGGGSAAASEEMYMQTKRTADEMPVVASVDAGALSGAYFTIAPADDIYVKPTSLVGSVGVLSPVPPDLEPNNLIGTTGPEKLASNERRFFHDLETAQAAFVGAVVSQREDRLALPRDELASGTTFVGSTGVRKGLADEVGGRQKAIRAAAEAAGIDRPEVRVLRPDGATVTFALRSTYLASSAENKRMDPPGTFVGTDARSGPPNFLMLPPSAVADAGTPVVGVRDGSARPVAGIDGAELDGAGETGDATETDETGDATDPPDDATTDGPTANETARLRDGIAAPRAAAVGTGVIA